MTGPDAGDDASAPGRFQPRFPAGPRHGSKIVPQTGQAHRQAVASGGRLDYTPTGIDPTEVFSVFTGGVQWHAPTRSPKQRSKPSSPRAGKNGYRIQASGPSREI